MFDVAVFGSLFLTLFVIMDPPGITPIFLALTAGRPAKIQRRMAFQAVAVAFGVIAVFGVLGQQILDYLHVSVPALMIAGGLLLLLIALDLLTGKTDEPTQTKDVNVALVPLGMPLLAGPGAIVSVILAVQHADSFAMQISVWTAIVAMHVVLWLAMRYSLLIIRVIKDGGVVLVTRLRRHDALRHRRTADHQRDHPGHPGLLRAPADATAPPYGHSVRGRFVFVRRQVLRSRGLGRADIDALACRGGLLHDPVDGGGVHDGAVHGGTVDIVESHDLEAHMASLRLILLLENYWEDGWSVRKDVEHQTSVSRAPHGVQRHALCKHSLR